MVNCSDWEDLTRNTASPHFGTAGSWIRSKGSTQGAGTNVRLDGREIGSLHNKHGCARGEHCHCGDCHDGPSQAGTRLALHQLLVRGDDQDCDEKEGS